jgi:hypothetical protein
MVKYRMDWIKHQERERKREEEEKEKERGLCKLCHYRLASIYNIPS